jgi:hypothetical protein
VKRESIIPKTGWRAAVVWGISAALVHRLLLGLWLALIWNVVSPSLDHASIDFHTAGARIPALTTPAEQTVFGVWRRWDAVHYLDLAENGYRVENAGATVFGVLTPLGFRLLDALLPGSLDLAAMVFETLTFALALALLYRVCEVYYGDAELGPWAAAVMALQPLSYFFAAPMSESIYLAMVLGTFYFAAKDRWRWAALCGFLATLARSQGVLLLPIALLMMVEKHWLEHNSWGERLRDLLARGWALALIPFGVLLFSVYRANLELPSLTQIYTDYSFVFFVNPLEGLATNVHWALQNPNQALFNIDLWAITLCILLALLTLRYQQHRRLPLMLYTFGYLLVFLSKLNWRWGTHEVMFTQSFARYSLALFPLTVLAADGLRHARFWGRIGMVLVILFALAVLSGLYVFALTGP